MDPTMGQMISDVVKIYNIFLFLVLHTLYEDMIASLLLYFLTSLMMLGNYLNPYTGKKNSSLAYLY